MTTPSSNVGADASREADLKLALDWALGILIQFEPGDSRAVSDEFVAAAAIQAEIEGNVEECREILRAAIARPTPPAGETK